MFPFPYCVAIMDMKTTKLEILKFCKHFWANFAGLYGSKDPTLLETSKNALLNLIHSFNMIQYIIGTIILCYSDMAELEVNQLLFAFLQINGTASAQITYFSIWLRKSEIRRMVNRFQKVVDERYSDATAEIYKRAEWIVEILVKWQLILSGVSICGGFAVLTCVILIISFIQGEMDVHKWPNLGQHKSVSEN